MGYDERGHCPMLVDGDCSIYDHRPRTCRMYAAGSSRSRASNPISRRSRTRVRDWTVRHRRPTTAWDTLTRAAFRPTGRRSNETFRRAQRSSLMHHGRGVRDRRHRGLRAEQQSALEDQRALVVQQVLPPVLDEELGDQHGDDRVRPALARSRRCRRASRREVARRRVRTISSGTSISCADHCFSICSAASSPSPTTVDGHEPVGRDRPRVRERFEQPGVDLAPRARRTVCRVGRGSRAGPRGARPTRV